MTHLFKLKELANLCAGTGEFMVFPTSCYGGVRTMPLGFGSQAEYDYTGNQATCGGHDW